MNTTAILAVRNEYPYIGNCLRYLIANGIPYIVIDNDSDDGTAELLTQKPFCDHLVEYAHYPFPGFFDWKGLMKAREEAAARCESEWVLFVSADEIMHSYRDNESLHDAIKRIDATGADVIDFNEFVFLPINRDYVTDAASIQPMHYYYFFEPTKPRLMRARRRELQVSHIQHGGHVLSGASYTLAEESFALRHYIFRTQRHALEKYATRKFSKTELDAGWHGNRHKKLPESFVFPKKEQLHCLENLEARNLDRSSPKDLHYWQW